VTRAGALPLANHARTRPLIAQSTSPPTAHTYERS
jgi:hypothetical protein